MHYVKLPNETIEEKQPPCNQSELIKALGDMHKVATGRIQHIYSGLCPDSMEGPDTRDIHCPACRILIKCDKLMSPNEY